MLFYIEDDIFAKIDVLDNCTITFLRNAAEAWRRGYTSYLLSLLFY